MRFRAILTEGGAESAPRGREVVVRPAAAVGEPSANGHAPKRSGAELLDEISRFIRRFVALSDEQADIIALWVVHTHAFDAADATGYLSIRSAEKRSGKTRLLETLTLVVARPWLTGRVTAAVLVRKVAAETPTPLLDESDAAFRGDKEYSETLRGVLNAGFRRGGMASLCVGQGANLTYQDFPVLAPKAIAGIGKLPDTIGDRSIPVELKRRAPGEHVERFRQRKVKPEAVPLYDAAAAWAEANLEAFSEAEPGLPEELDDRAQDIVEPLLAVADAAGGEWPERAPGRRGAPHGRAPGGLGVAGRPAAAGHPRRVRREGDGPDAHDGHPHGAQQAGRCAVGEPARRGARRAGTGALPQSVRHPAGAGLDRRGQPPGLQAR
jgi:hypothetical protein